MNFGPDNHILRIIQSLNLNFDFSVFWNNVKMAEMKIQDQSAANMSHGIPEVYVESSAALFVSYEVSFHRPRRKTSDAVENMCWC